MGKKMKNFNKNKVIISIVWAKNNIICLTHIKWCTKYMATIFNDLSLRLEYYYIIDFIESNRNISIISMLLL